jgi:hypothetical protein
MQLFKKRTETIDEGKEQLAGRIAFSIIRWQMKLSAVINKAMNKYSKTTQKKSLWLFCAIWVLITGFNIFRSQRQVTIQAVKSNYLPAHIGKPSEIPKQTLKPVRQTDSLTIKK